MSIKEIKNIEEKIKKLEEEKKILESTELEKNIKEGMSCFNSLLAEFKYGNPNKEYMIDQIRDRLEESLRKQWEFFEKKYKTEKEFTWFEKLLNKIFK